MHRASKHESRKKFAGNLHSMHLLATVGGKRSGRLVERARGGRQRAREKKVKKREKANARASENAAHFPLENRRGVMQRREKERTRKRRGRKRECV